MANNLDPEIDNLFNVGTDFRSTFFIGGKDLGSFADVKKERELEFREIILRVKPLHNVAFLTFFVILRS